ncbi:MAG: ATP-binding protein [Ruminococcus sp.]|nr:ATP-binding protein [Ruminococcus sp.]
MMKYSDSAFEKADLVIEQRRRKAENDQQNRMLEISKDAPEVEILQRNLRNTGLELVKLIMQGGNDTHFLIEKIKEKNLSTQHTIEELLEAVKGDRHYLDVHYYCEKCKDTGYSEGRRCSCMEDLLRKFTTEELNRNCLIELHDFSEFFLDFYDKSSDGSFSPYEKMRQNLEYCKEYAENFNTKSPSLFFFGKTGLGKTFLSSCIAKAMLEKNVNVAFGSIIDFLRKIENEHFGKEQGDTLNILIDADIVILDDLGSEFLTAFTESALYDIINCRINLSKPTIISTNLSYSELDRKYNERIVSRLTGCFVPLSFVGKDIRHIKMIRNMR